MNTSAVLAAAAKIEAVRQQLVVPQLHSFDYFARLHAPELEGLRWSHIETFLDEDANPVAGSSPTVSGATEWQTVRAGAALSLGWDWVRAPDGSLAPSLSIPLRTNILLIDALGYDLARETTDICLWSIIGTIPWQAQVRAELVQLLPDTRRLN